MTSFFEKLKKGMGIKSPMEEISSQPSQPEGIKEKTKAGPKKMSSSAGASSFDDNAAKIKVKKLKLEINPAEPETKKRVRSQISQLKKEEEPKTEKKDLEPQKEKWFEPEGELAVNVYQTDEELIIQSAIAGIKVNDLDISIEADKVSIQGNRKEPAQDGEKSYFLQECYWGPFSRQIILPVETDPSRAQASMEEGVLTIKIPKIERQKKRKISIKAY